MNKSTFLLASLCLMGTTLLAKPAKPSTLPTAVTAAKPGQPNVLFIVSDDLRNWLGCYGDPQARTPNLDRLAARGTLFKTALPGTPLCNPSRTSFLTGMRPSQTGVYDNNVGWMRAVPNAMTIPLLFKNNGYYVSGAGKITHASFVRDSDWNDFGPVKLEKIPSNRQLYKLKWAIVPDPKEPELEDYVITSYVAERIKQKRDKPFFLACGLHRPHTDWNVSQKYVDLYPLDSIKQPVIKANDLDDVPPIGVDMAHGHFVDTELRAIPQGPEKIIQAYRAAISAMDAQVGRLLDALDASPAKNNTIIVFIGDNGWHHGEKEHWGKATLWKESDTVPLICVVPGVTKPGTVCEHPVDFLSLFPTFCDLTGLSVPAQCKGPSLRPLLADPTAPWDHPALSTMHRGNHSACDDRFRYIRYADGTEELYDHTKDPNEWTNVAKNPEFAPIKARLAKVMPNLQQEAQTKVWKGKADSDE